MKKWIGAALGIFGLSENHAVAIIGGADGPTSVFVAGKVGNGDIVLGIAVAVLVILGIIWFVSRKKK